MVYGNFKDLARKATSDKVLCDKELSIAKNPIYDRYQRGLASVTFKCFDKKFLGGAVTRARYEILSTKLAEEL